MKNNIEKKYFRMVRDIYCTVSEIGESHYAVHLKSDNAASEYIKYLSIAEPYLKGFHEPRGVDWGALYGHVTALFVSAGYNTIPYVVEPSPGSKKVLDKYFGASVTYGDNQTKLPFADGDFDFLISSGVLEHVQEGGGSAEASIKEIWRVLKDEGIFFIWKLPNASGLAEIKSDVLGTWAHPFRYTPAGIRLLLQNNGFEVLEFRYDGLLPSRANTILRGVGLSFVVRFCEWLAEKPFFRVFANDFIVVARKRQ